MNNIMNNKISNSDKILKIKEFARSIFETEIKDGTHDFLHTLRVFHLCEKISKEENADMEILLASALLHDIGHVQPGDHAENSGKIAPGILNKLNFSDEKIKKIIYAISVHRYSKGKIPGTIEAKILQDADRIDALGAVGIMRTFAYLQNSKNFEITRTSGSHYCKRKLYNACDPFYETNRELNDKEYALDHFYRKLLKLPGLMHTKTGKEIAKTRKKFMIKFIDELKKEITV